MESLRWVLLGAGLVFVLIIYLLGRSRRQRRHSVIDELEDDLPEFSAQSLDDIDEGVGEVRVITDTAESEVAGIDISSGVVSDVDGAGREEPSAASSPPQDIIVLYILAKPEELLFGSQINSAVQAMGLRFGDMNIFHYQPDRRKVFSLANMMEPGSFDENTIHDLKTSGLTVFMQLQSGDPLDDLTEMLQRSYQLAGLLDARFCNHKREPLTEQDAENYRTQVAAFIASEKNEAESDTTSDSKPTTKSDSKSATKTESAEPV